MGSRATEASLSCILENMQKMLSIKLFAAQPEFALKFTAQLPFMFIVQDWKEGCIP